MKILKSFKVLDLLEATELIKLEELKFTEMGVFDD